MEKQNEIDEMLSSNILKWVTSYYQVITCHMIMKSFNEAVTRTAINNHVNAECNSMLRKVAKFKPYMSPDVYENTCVSIQDLKSDTQNIIIKALSNESVILV